MNASHAWIKRIQQKKKYYYLKICTSAADENPFEKLFFVVVVVSLKYASWESHQGNCGRFPLAADAIPRSARTQSAGGSLWPTSCPLRSCNSRQKYQRPRRGDMRRGRSSRCCHWQVSMRVCVRGSLPIEEGLSLLDLQWKFVCVDLCLSVQNMM